MTSPIAKVKQGSLKGSLETTAAGQSYVSFKGIPYAKPPLGDLRFKNPQPPESWHGIRDATAHRDSSLHVDMFTQAVTGSEDCLYLNVYVPLDCWKNAEKHWKCSRSAYPVMVWIHGGAFKSDSGNAEDYGPDYFMSNQETILVTINYRLEALGFLSLDNEDAPGNAGLKDQSAALKWVNENIASFGGNNRNITIFGESAGSVAVTLHMFSPLSKGLFSKVIAQSGVCINFWAVTQNYTDLAFRLGKLLGLETEDKDELGKFLMSVPATDLVGLFGRMLTPEDHREDILHHFGPVIESIHVTSQAFITESPVELLRRGEFQKVPLMLGYNSGEGMMFVKKLLGCADEVNADFERFIPADLRPFITDEDEHNIANKIREFYFSDQLLSEDKISEIIKLRTDQCFTYGVHRFAKLCAEKSHHPVYFYVFNCRTRLNLFANLFQLKGDATACHADDLTYLFPRFRNVEDLNTVDGKLISRTVKMWTNMAVHGDPTPQRGQDTLEVKWKPVTKQEFSYCEMGQKLTVGVNPDGDRVQFWDKIYESVRESNETTKL